MCPLFAGRISKLWQFRYYRPLTKQRTKQSLGAYPAVSLSDVRKLRAESRALLTKDIDAQEHQKEQVRNSQEYKTNTFLLVAEHWWNVKKASVTEDYAEDIWRSLEKDVFPAIGDISVTEIKAHTWLKQFNQSGQSRIRNCSPPEVAYSDAQESQRLSLNGQIHTNGHKQSRHSNDAYIVC